MYVVFDHMYPRSSIRHQLWDSDVPPFRKRKQLQGTNDRSSQLDWNNVWLFFFAVRFIFGEIEWKSGSAGRWTALKIIHDTANEYNTGSVFARFNHDLFCYDHNDINSPKSIYEVRHPKHVFIWTTILVI